MQNRDDASLSHPRRFDHGNYFFSICKEAFCAARNFDKSVSLRFTASWASFANIENKQLLTSFRALLCSPCKSVNLAASVWPSAIGIMSSLFKSGLDAFLYYSNFTGSRMHRTSCTSIHLAATTDDKTCRLPLFWKIVPRQAATFSLDGST